MNIAEYLRTAILELKDIDEEKLVPELSFEDLELDSLDYVEVQLLVQKKYKVEIGPDLFSSGKLKVLGDLYAYIATHQPSTLAA